MRFASGAVNCHHSGAEIYQTAVTERLALLRVIPTTSTNVVGDGRGTAECGRFASVISYPRRDLRTERRAPILRRPLTRLLPPTTPGTFERMAANLGIDG